MVGSARGRSVRVGTIGAVVLLAGTMLLAGCGGGDSSDSSGSPAYQTAGDKAGLPAAAPGQEKAGAPAALPVGTASRALIYTGTLSVTTPKVTAAATSAVQATRQAGGYVASDVRTTPEDSSDQPTVKLVLRVPSAKFGAVVEQLSALGRERDRSLGTEDQQSATVDLNSRITTQKASVARTRALLARAQSIADIVSIERELSTREAELASSQSTAANLADQIAYSTITLSLSAKHVVKHAEPTDQPGFLTGLRNGWSAFLTVIVALGAALGWLLPFLVALGALAFVARTIWRRTRRNTAPALAGAPAPTDPAPEA
jgi:hypothetical protein